MHRSSDATPKYKNTNSCTKTRAPWSEDLVSRSGRSVCGNPSTRVRHHSRDIRIIIINSFELNYYYFSLFFTLLFPIRNSVGASSPNGGAPPALVTPPSSDPIREPHDVHRLTPLNPFLTALVVERKFNWLPWAVRCPKNSPFSLLWVSMLPTFVETVSRDQSPFSNLLARERSTQLCSHVHVMRSSAPADSSILVR